LDQYCKIQEFALSEMAAKGSEIARQCRKLSACRAVTLPSPENMSSIFRHKHQHFVFLDPAEPSNASDDDVEFDFQDPMKVDIQFAADIRIKVKKSMTSVSLTLNENARPQTSLFQLLKVDIIVKSLLADVISSGIH
jgi:hypothetical protein